MLNCFQLIDGYRGADAYKIQYSTYWTLFIHKYATIYDNIVTMLWNKVFFRNFKILPSGGEAGDFSLNHHC